MWGFHGGGGEMWEQGAAEVEESVVLYGEVDGYGGGGVGVEECVAEVVAAVWDAGSGDAGVVWRFGWAGACGGSMVCS